VDRRAFLSTVAGGLLTAPLVAGGQQKAKAYTLGFLSGVTPIDRDTAALEQGLHDLGWLKGQNIAIEYRSAEGNLDRLPALATELVSLKVDLIVAVSAPETSAARRATISTPIVFVVHGDPVGTGDVQSLAHPGGTTTGVAQMHPELTTKQLEILQQLVPRVSRTAVLWNAANPAKVGDWRERRPSAHTLGIALQSSEVRRPTDLSGAFATIRKQRPDAMLILGDPLTVSSRVPIADFAVKEHLPVMYPLRLFVEAGGLISYGADVTDLFRRAARYVDKILKGAKPADLPVEQPTKFELVINLKTAKALGLTIPQSLLVRADQVIE